MIKLAVSFKRNDNYVPAAECGVITQVGEYATIATAALAAGVAIAAAPVVVLSATAVSAGLLTAGHIVDHKKLDAQDNTPVADAPVA
jgi:hypothetical protein